MTMEIETRRTVFTTDWFSVEEKKLASESASYFSVKCADYVSIVALTGNDELVLVRQFRPAVEEQTVELPSGHIDPGESASAAAARELFEETGYVAESLEEMGVIRPDIGRLSNRMHCFFAKVRGPSNSWRLEPGVQPITFPRVNVLRSMAFAMPILTNSHCVAAIGMALLQSKF
jgi:ADP-ribose pyrophosphatase